MTDVTIYYLEMKGPQLHRQKTDAKGLAVYEALVGQGKVNRFLYDLIGADWHWHERLGWSLQQWNDYAKAENLRTWIAYYQGSIAGYFELKKIDGTDTEIAYFGLAPDFVGQGFGGYLLSQAICEAWAWGGTGRVILNTCTLDHPNALANYKARGFSIYTERVYRPGR